MGRGRKRIIVCGFTETGKSTLIKEMIEPRMPIDKIAVHDPNRQAAWLHLPEITLDEFARMKKGMYRITDPDYKRFFRIAFESFRNGIIISEDASNYLTPLPNMDIYPNLIALRHNDVDLIMITHSLKRTPNYIIEQTNELLLKKTNDVWKRVSDRFQDPDKVKPYFDRVNSSKNQYEWERIILSKTGTL